MNSWTTNEIEKVRADFMSGKKIKVIASELGRSLTAVNKFISRSGLRNNKRPRERISVTGDRHQISVNRNALQETFCYNPIKYDDFSDVILYLRENGHNITRVKSLFASNCEYMLNGKPASKANVLLTANKLKTEEWKPIFKVADIMFGEI
jgi:hypothetical protein